MQEHSNNNINVFLFGAIFNILASIDFYSLLDYALKATIGGGIWLGFKILGDYFQSSSKHKEKDGKE